MRSLTFITLFSLFFTINCRADEVCVVGAGIEQEAASFTYTTGIGADGAEPKPIKAMNENVKGILSTAVKEMSSKHQYCLKGTVRKGILEVIAIEKKVLSN